MMDLDELLPIERQQLLEEEGQHDESYYPEKTSLVRFGGDSVDYIESSADMTDEEKTGVWYTRSELRSFKDQARQLCKQQKLGILATNDSTRGMDVYFPSRQRAHAKYVYHILQAYYVHYAGNPEYVAQLSEKWSFRSKERALAVGIQDTYEAYFPSMVSQTEVPTVSRKRAAYCEPERRFIDMYENRVANENAYMTAFRTERNIN
jgi:hypothetical protein